MLALLSTWFEWSRRMVLDQYPASLNTRRPSHTRNCALAISRHIVTIHLTLAMSGLLLVIGSCTYRQMYEDLCHAVPDLEQTA